LTAFLLIVHFGRWQSFQKRHKFNAHNFSSGLLGPAFSLFNSMSYEQAIAQLCSEWRSNAIKA